MRLNSRQIACSRRGECHPSLPRTTKTTLRILRCVSPITPGSLSLMGSHNKQTSVIRTMWTVVDPSPHVLRASSKEVFQWQLVAPLVCPLFSSAFVELTFLSCVPVIPHCLMEDDIYNDYFLPKDATILGNARYLFFALSCRQQSLLPVSSIPPLSAPTPGPRTSPMRSA